MNTYCIIFPIRIIKYTSLGKAIITKGGDELRLQDKQWFAGNNKDIFGVDLHRFNELDGHANYMEIAEEFGISIGEVKILKKKLNRS